jgi:hypothetical protein
MFDPDDLSGLFVGGHEVIQDSRQISRSRPNIEDLGTWV